MRYLSMYLNVRLVLVYLSPPMANTDPIFARSSACCTVVPLASISWQRTSATGGKWSVNFTRIVAREISCYQGGSKNNWKSHTAPLHRIPTNLWREVADKVHPFVIWTTAKHTSLIFLIIFNFPAR